ncbi:MAG: isoprenylcysteine carboxylmethyltransferase family protein [Euryarchaeota archaeon]|nr:isoprenylcysteine carboxylmethyltransferase family protein [Euryarchaeota archaeon]
MDPYWFVVPLVAGVLLVGASAFTTSIARRWGARNGTRICAALRTYTGMPLVIVGMVLALVAPGSFLWPWNSIALGGVLIVVGLTVFIWAHVQLGKPTGWPSVEDRLVDRGLYGAVRHPIYSATVLIALGLLVAHPTPNVAVGVAILLPSLAAQALLEEMDLKQRIPQYVHYMRRVPRFVPRLRRGAP